MDTTQIKNYAIQARRDFITSVEARAAQLGIGKNTIEPFKESGDMLIQGHMTLPKTCKPALSRLIENIKVKGYNQVIEEVAYTWFNRFMALRFMEIHGYLEGRVLSSESGHVYPDIYQHADQVELGGLIDKSKVSKLKIAGDKDEELYQYLIKTVCQNMHHSMPFLFEKLNDETELLMPDKLLNSDSIIRKLVNEIPEDKWKEGVEIIGWLYQFYISEKKAQVIGKVVKSADIPA
ncbi:MAG: type II restriction enzyme, partial [uncultured bacterium]